MITVVIVLICIIVGLFLWNKYSHKIAPAQEVFLDVTSQPVRLRQKFTLIGWIGVALIFVSPLVMCGMMLVDAHYAAQTVVNEATTHDYGWHYLVLGYFILLGVVLVIIGRDFYAVSDE